MQNRLTVLTAACLVVLTTLPAAAQVSIVQDDLPSEAVLNRYGLTLDWWARATVDPTRERISHVTLDEQNVYVQSTSGILSAIHGESGRVLWSRLIGAPDQQAFEVSSNEEQLFLAVGMQIFALNKQTGDIVWRLRLPHHPAAPPGVDDETVYIGAVEGSVYAYELRRIRTLYAERRLPEFSAQALAWRFQTPGSIVSTPVSTGTTVSFGSAVGSVYGVTSRDLRLRFQFESDGKIRAPLGRSQEYLFIADQNSRVYAIRFATGQIEWTLSTPTPVQEQPRAVGSQVFVIPFRKGMTAVSVNSGITQWTIPQVSEFVAASEMNVYGFDEQGNLLIMRRFEGGDIVGAIPLRKFSIRVNNDRTDRIVLCTERGLIVSLREKEFDFPIYHLFPERRPLLPEFASEEPETDAADSDSI